MYCYDLQSTQQLLPLLLQVTNPVFDLMQISNGGGQVGFTVTKRFVIIYIMTRPTRIEYEGAFHHVMNRGRNRKNIFHDERYYEEFLKCLKEATEQFEAVIHAYCLMTDFRSCKISIHPVHGNNQPLSLID